MEKIDGNVKILVKKGTVNINQSLVTGKIKVEDGGLKVSLSSIPPSRNLDLELGKGILEMQIPGGTEVRDLSDPNLKSKVKGTEKPPAMNFFIRTKLDSGELIIKRT
ncbi:MAG: hypothetical protein B7Y39_18625 [Bdellovibrio sp. 28-41-41]|nr:MAG: hypothetical protein B7Y39_18625 [Bdellovibrio sp. 28-41-41]